MDREYAKQAAEILKAYADGKTIQYKPKSPDKNHENWHIVLNPVFDFATIEYRVKPGPQFRPYKNAKEFLTAQKEHGPYIDTESWPSLGTYTIPYSVNDSRVYWKAGYDLYSNWEELSHHKWQDGTQCGILE